MLFHFGSGFVSACCRWDRDVEEYRKQQRREVFWLAIQEGEEGVNTGRR